MVALTDLLVPALLVPVISAAAPYYPITGTCKTVAPCVSTLRTYSSRSAFCSTWLGITTRTSTAIRTATATATATATSTTTSTSTSTDTITNTDTSTTTSITGTDTVTADAVTIMAHGESIIAHEVSETATDHITTEWAPTPTVEAPTSTATVTTTTTTVVCGNQKRAATAASKSVPSPLKSFQSSVISSGCKCLSLPTPTTTTTTTTTTTMTMTATATATDTVMETTSITTSTSTTEVQNVAATETTTPTTTATYRITSTPTFTTTVTPTTTLTPPAVTTTPTTTVTMTQTSTIRAGVAGVQLANPTPITPVRNGLATQSLDDQTGWKIQNLPFDVSLYDVTSRTLIVGLNGWVSPGTRDSGTFVNTALPNVAAGDPSWVAYWSDLYIVAGTPQGIYYEITGEAPNRVLSIEYFMSFYRNAAAYTHFLINIFENEAGRVAYTYFQTTSLKATTNTIYGTIGVQRPGTGQYNQYSINVQPRQGLAIEWRPSTNQWREISSGAQC